MYLTSLFILTFADWGEWIIKIPGVCFNCKNVGLKKFLKLINGSEKIVINSTRMCMVQFYLRYICSKSWYYHFLGCLLSLLNCWIIFQVNVPNQKHAQYLEGQVAHHVWKVLLDILLKWCYHLFLQKQFLLIFAQLQLLLFWKFWIHYL